MKEGVTKSTAKVDTLRVKKLDVPTFSGNIREYPAFKRDYELHMLPSFGKDPFALRSCLQGSALETIHGLYDNFEEMMDRLDTKYGCPAKLVDAIIMDIRKLKRVSDDDSSKFLKMIEVVEKSWQDLKGMGLEAEMNTSLMTSQVEKLLPPIQKREWTLARQTLLRNKQCCTFKNLLEFLRAEREAIEYMNEELRIESKKVNMLKSDGDGKVANILKVDSEGESHNEVNKEIQSMKEMIEGLVQAVKGISMSNNSNSSNYSVNQTISKKCWYHSADNHDITNCNAFDALDPKARLELVRRNFVCFSCLKTGHIS